MRRFAMIAMILAPSGVLADEAVPDRLLFDLWVGKGAFASSGAPVIFGTTLLMRGRRFEAGLGLDTEFDVLSSHNHGHTHVMGGAVFDLDRRGRADALLEVGMHEAVPFVGARAGIGLRAGPILLGGWLILREDLATIEGTSENPKPGRLAGTSMILAFRLGFEGM